ncbi:MAG: ABC transporter ATP-binding protein [Ancrocorticia sp.]
MALIELHEVTRHVKLPSGDDLHILQGVNLSVEAGEHISIVGRSGTGKSTLLNIIGMLDKPSSGSYTIDGKDAVKLREGRRAQMRGDTFGFVFQQFNIFNARTAQENVEVPLLYTTGALFWRRHELAADMLGRVGLGDRLDSYPTEMSGGEQQRIAIARSLVRQPRIILADEPTGALDPDTGRSVMGLLEEIAAENNAALIVITHDLNVAVRAHRVLALYDGVLHDVENAREVLIPTELGAASRPVGAELISEATDKVERTDQTIDSLFAAPENRDQPVAEESSVTDDDVAAPSTELAQQDAVVDENTKQSWTQRLRRGQNGNA